MPKRLLGVNSQKPLGVSEFVNHRNNQYPEVAMHPDTKMRNRARLKLPTLERVVDAIFRVDMDFNIRFVSEPGCRWFSGTAPSDLPSNFLTTLHPDDAVIFKSASAGSPEFFTCEIRLIKHGSECWVNIRSYLLPDEHQYMVCIFDISSWKTADANRRHACDHDELTGLPNRVFLKRLVEAQIRDDKVFSVALLDLDGFKKVNDTFGHTIGDAVLVETAKRLTSLSGSESIFARLNGDQFVLLLHGKDEHEANEEMAKVLCAIARPYDTAPHDVYLSTSIGIASCPAHGKDYSTLLKNADTAMFFAKNSGRNRVSIFQESKENNDFSIRAAIHRGIREGEFTIEFQPQFDMERTLVGAEALMRWTSRDFGRVPPDKFIPVVEDAGLISYLGKWALRFSCHQLKKFHQLFPDFVMSVNVSPLQFCADDFVSVVLESIAEAGVDPANLILEITESTLMHSQEKTERALAVLCEKGVRFSIDDFGTGFSSLAYLTRLPVSSIKIDKAFIESIEGRSDQAVSNKRLVTAMINLAHSVDLKVVAEGVEEEGQFAFLKDSGCDLIQGYLLGKPMSADSLINNFATKAREVA